VHTVTRSAAAREVHARLRPCSPGLLATPCLFAFTLLACAAFGASACARSEPPVPLAELPIVLRASTPEGAVVSGLRAWADGRELGSTRGDGVLSASLRGHEGQRIALSFACPPGQRTLDAQREVALRRMQAIASGAAALTISVACEPIERVAALVVRARGPRSHGLPVLVGGEVVAHTAHDGTAHLLIPTRAHSTLRVTIDTKAAPALRPISPVQTFEVRDADRLLLFDQRFALDTRTPVARQPSIRRPYRID
jgi:hypothetical protein